MKILFEILKFWIARLSSEQTRDGPEPFNAVRNVRVEQFNCYSWLSQSLAKLKFDIAKLAVSNGILGLVIRLPTQPDKFSPKQTVTELAFINRAPLVRIIFDGPPN